MDAFSRRILGSAIGETKRNPSYSLTASTGQKLQMWPKESVYFFWGTSMEEESKKKARRQFDQEFKKDSSQTC